MTPTIPSLPKGEELGSDNWRKATESFKDLDEISKKVSIPKWKMFKVFNTLVISEVHYAKYTPSGDLLAFL